MSEDLSKAHSVPVLRYAAADIVRRHATELAKSAISPAQVEPLPKEEEELKVEDQNPVDSPRSESSASEDEPQKENLFEDRGGISLTQSTPIPIATAQDIIRLSDSLSSSAPESYNDSSPISLGTLSTRQRSHSTGTAISQDELERKVLFDAFSANKGAGAEKLHKFFGMPIAFESFVSVAPQPRHVKEYKMKKIFGEEIPLEHRQGIQRSMDDEDVRYMNESQKNRRVGKFFGESLNVSQPASLQEPFGLSRRVSRMLQPEHVDVGKLNKFFGRPTYIQKEKEEEGQEEEDSSAMERQQIKQQIKKSRKLRNYFGESQPVLDPNAKQFAPQPAHVKGYKLSKHFGCHVVIEHGTDSKSNTNSSTDSMANSSNSNTITVEQPENVAGDEPVVKRELLLLLPDRTLDVSPRVMSASDGGTRSSRKASKILGESLTPSKKEISNSHREPLYKEGKKSHREKDKDKDKDKDKEKDKDKDKDRDDEQKEHKEKEKKKKEDK